MSAMSITTRPIIGMEIHVHLATASKMFCRCPVTYGDEPNTATCPVCLGMPGVLPVINRQAYEFAVITAIALGCQIARHTKWDRKSYYYPDLPKNYQISQYDLPLSHDGRFEIPTPDGGSKAVGIIRAHLEEDAGRNVHDRPGFTGVDLNRAGVPLLEIVTAPDMASADEAHAFAVELQRLVRHLGVSEADMQKGQMRFEPNVNVAIVDDGREYRTPIAEVKNLNSFRAIRSAVAYEIDRQIAEWQADHGYTLDRLGKINCGWRDDAGVTEVQRTKEEAHDYRYFPDPDLVPVEIDDAWLADLRGRVCELPVARRSRFQRDYGLSPRDAETLCEDRATAELFDAAVAAGGDATTLGKQFISFWAQQANTAGRTIAGLGVEAARMAELSAIVADGTISATAAAEVAAEMLTDPAGPREIAERLGRLQVGDADQIATWVDQAIAANPQAVDDALGNPKKAKKAVGFLTGQVMKLSDGQANPGVVGPLIAQRLDARRGG